MGVLLIHMQNNDKISGIYRTASLLKQTTTHSLSRARLNAGSEWDYVLKVFTPELFPTQEQQEAFVDAMQPFTRLYHPHILTVREVIVEGDRICVATPYAAHGSLQDRLDKHSGPLPVAESSLIMTQIGLALQYAHDQKMLHTNIKPENILFTASDSACLADFCPPLLARQRLSQNSLYAAPEEVRGHQTYRSDQYALAAVAYQLFTGKVPFLSDEQVRNLDYTIQPPSSINSEISPQIEKVLLKALSAEPSERYVNVKAFIDALTGASTVVEPITDPLLLEALQPAPMALQNTTAQLQRLAKKRAGGRQRLFITIACLFLIALISTVQIILSGSLVNNVPLPPISTATEIDAPVLRATITSISTSEVIVTLEATQEATSVPGTRPTPDGQPTQVPATPSVVQGGQVTPAASQGVPPTPVPTPTPKPPTNPPVVNTAPVGSVIWLLAAANNYYVSARFQDPGRPVYATSVHVSDWEFFEVIDVGNGNIALRETVYGNYVSVLTSATNAPLHVESSQIQINETFRWIDLGNGKVALQANSNGKYVSVWASEQGKPLKASSSSVQVAETFQWGRV